MIFSPFSFLNQEVGGVAPTPTPTPTQSSTPTPTPTPTPPPTPTFIPDNLRLYVDANNSSSYPGTGTIWYDLSANDYDATLNNGPVFVSGATPYYFDFDGSNDNATFTTATIGSDTGTYTWGGWIMHSSNTNQQVAFIRGIVSSSWSLMISKPNNNNTFIASFVDNNDARTNTAAYSFTSGVWYQVYAVWKPSSYLKLYVNGSLIDTVNHSASTLKNNASNGWRISSNTVGTNWNGNVGNFSVYDTELTASEILNNYNAQKGTYGY